MPGGSLSTGLLLCLRNNEVLPPPGQVIPERGAGRSCNASDDQHQQHTPRFPLSATDDSCVCCGRRESPGDLEAGVNGSSSLKLASTLAQCPHFSNFNGIMRNGSGWLVETIRH